MGIRNLLGIMVLAALCGVPALAAQNAAGEDYVLQPSDVIAVKYRLTPEFDFTGAVLPDGMITPPLLGSIKIAGLTVSQAHDAVVAKAGERLRDPQVTIEVREFQKPYFVVGGEVGAPGKFELRGRVGVLEAIAIAGGFKSGAKRSQVVLYRRYDEQTAIARVIKTNDLAATDAREFAIQSGDFIVIPQSGYAKIEKFIPLANLALFNPLMWK